MWNKFLLIFFIPVIIILLPIAIFNYTVDPYHLRDTEGKAGINFSRIYSADRERALKPLMYLRAKPEVVILGDSKSGFSIVPDKISEILNLKSSFNLSLRNATPLEIYEHLKFSIDKNKNLKHIIICFDFEMMGQFNKVNSGFSTSILNTGYLSLEDKFTANLSLSSLCDSVMTIRENNEKNLPKIYSSSGEISEQYLVKFFEKEGNFNRNSDVVFTNYKLVNQDKKTRKIFLKSYYRDMIILNKIKELLTESNIKYSIIILPTHPYEISAINNNFYLAWRKEIKNIFPEIIDLTSAFKDEKNFYYDAAHPKKEPTMELFNNIFANKNIPTYEFKINNKTALGKEFYGEIELDNSLKTTLINLDAKLLRYGIIHLAAYNDIESKNAYFLLESDGRKFLFKASRYGEPHSQNIISVITKKYENYTLDARGVTDNLPHGKYKVFVGELRENVFATDGAKYSFVY